MKKAVIWAATGYPCPLGSLALYPSSIRTTHWGFGCRFYSHLDLFKLSLLFFSTFEAIYF